MPNTQPQSSTVLDLDQEQEKPISKALQDFIDGNRSMQDILEEVIEETDELTVDDFLGDLMDCLMACEQSEVRLRLMILLAEIQNSEKVAKVDMKNMLFELFTEVVDGFRSMFISFSIDLCRSSAK